MTPAPAFEVLGAEPVPHAAAPTLRFAMRVAEPTGADVHAIALAAQLHIDPARRSYDDATRERLVELFGEPDRWSATTRSFLWAQLGTVVPAFRARRSSRSTSRAPTTWRWRRPSTSTRCPTARSR